MMVGTEFRTHLQDPELVRLAGIAWSLCIAHGDRLYLGGTVPNALAEDFQVLGWMYVPGRELFVVDYRANPAEQRAGLVGLIDYLGSDSARLAEFAATTPVLFDRPALNGTQDEDAFTMWRSIFFGRC